MKGWLSRMRTQARKLGSPKTGTPVDMVKVQQEIAEQRAEKEGKQKAYEQKLEKWQKKRDKIIEEYFLCPICDGTDFQPVFSSHTHGTRTGGVRMPYIDPRQDGFSCDGCSVRFDSPEMFTKDSQWLKNELELHNRRKPRKPKEL